MKAIDLAKKLYPKMTKTEIINQYCPDTLQMCDKIDCEEGADCKVCWDREISEARCKWLLESRRMCDLLC
jgi:hypothetical protein